MDPRSNLRMRNVDRPWAGHTCCDILVHVSYGDIVICLNETRPYFGRLKQDCDWSAKQKPDRTRSLAYFPPCAHAHMISGWGEGRPSLAPPTNHTRMRTRGGWLARLPKRWSANIDVVIAVVVQDRGTRLLLLVYTHHLKTSYKRLAI